MSFLLCSCCCLLFNDFIRAQQHARRHRQTDLLGCIQIDDKLELRELLDGQFSRLGAFDHLVRILNGTRVECQGIWFVPD